MTSLLLALYGWHDSLVCVWREDVEGDLRESRALATKLAVEAALIASTPVRIVLEDVQRRFFDVQHLIFDKRVPVGSNPLAGVLQSLIVLDDSLRVELAQPRQPPRTAYVRLPRRRAVESDSSA